jgi:predicted transcriptional regulator
MRKPGPPSEIPPPLELQCLKALWTLGEGDVKDVRGALIERRPLAYTTVMTILDRLAKRGSVARRKAGRRYIYTPSISRDTLRQLAVEALVEDFFDGSERDLRQYLGGASPSRPAPEVTDHRSILDASLL